MTVNDSWMPHEVVGIFGGSLATLAGAVAAVAVWFV